ncbi:hypothetical protein Ciccas_010866, partial [Cichlidogyrus casuarinus]
MSFLERWQRIQEKGDLDCLSDAALREVVKDKRVVILGGGDTGVDCMATALRLGAKSIDTLEILPEPPRSRADGNPWPEWPRIWRMDYGHEEVALHYGRDPRHFSVQTKRFLDNGKGEVDGIEISQVKWIQETSGGPWKMIDHPESTRILKCDLVLLAMGFLGPEKSVLASLSLDTDQRSNVKTKPGQYKTNVESVYAAG